MPNLKVLIFDDANCVNPNKEQAEQLLQMKEIHQIPE